MKQSDNPEAFFEKYGFTSTRTQKHPVFKDMMHFEGLEANYVADLEFKVEQLEKYIKHQQERIDWLMNKEFYKWKDLDRLQLEKDLKK